jgi:hypothetical protein
VGSAVRRERFQNADSVHAAVAESQSPALASVAVSAESPNAPHPERADVRQYFGPATRPHSHPAPPALPPHRAFVFSLNTWPCWIITSLPDRSDGIEESRVEHLSVRDAVNRGPVKRWSRTNPEPTRSVERTRRSGRAVTDSLCRVARSAQPHAPDSRASRGDQRAARTQPRCRALQRSRVHWQPTRRCS